MNNDTTKPKAKTRLSSIGLKQSTAKRRKENAKRTARLKKLCRMSDSQLRDVIAETDDKDFSHNKAREILHLRERPLKAKTLRVLEVELLLIPTDAQLSNISGRVIEDRLVKCRRHELKRIAYNAKAPLLRKTAKRLLSRHWTIIELKKRGRKEPRNSEFFRLIEQSKKNPERIDAVRRLIKLRTKPLKRKEFKVLPFTLLFEVTDDHLKRIERELIENKLFRCSTDELRRLCGAEAKRISTPAAWLDHNRSLPPQMVEFSSPDEVPETVTYSEGATQRVSKNSYERNPKARAACIAHYGPRCVICAFDFSEFYGAAFQDRIHVHHVRALATIGGEYAVDPVKDLRPVCPNCHAMLHTVKPAMGLETLRRIVDERRGGA
ncbi:MAG: hypothetical protein GX575_25685 [Candidatus Anammoximicrobium sp.]|nr:hypothetical protein [Candidatus Anammoximicrobium sp.]